MGLVTRESGGIAPHTIDISAAALGTECLLDGVDMFVVAQCGAAGAPELAGQGRHGRRIKRGDTEIKNRSERLAGGGGGVGCRASSCRDGNLWLPSKARSTGPDLFFPKTRHVHSSSTLSNWDIPEHSGRRTNSLAEKVLRAVFTPLISPFWAFIPLVSASTNQLTFYRLQPKALCLLAVGYPRLAQAALQKFASPSFTHPRSALNPHVCPHIYQTNSRPAELALADTRNASAR